ncbi:MAG: PAS domain S-box protein [Bryobacterales bacterium]|nr:PAS domain S-box protein [Bryobacterales bacterium]
MDRPAEPPHAAGSQPPALDEGSLRDLARETIPIVWTTDAGGHVHEDSPSWRAFTGQSKEEWMGDGWLNAIHPEDRAAARAAWSEAVRARSAYSIEYRLRHGGGEWRWTAARGYALAGPDGDVLRWIGVNVDITALKTAELAARETEERFRLLVDNTANTAIFLLDPQGRIHSWNLGAERITGYTADEVLGRHISMFLPEAARNEGAAERLLDRARECGEAKLRALRVRRDGSPFWADIIIAANRDAQGVLRSFSDFMRDVTEERNHLLAVEESEQRARLLLENAAQGILGVRADGVIELVNSTACRIFGYEQDELTGQSIESLLPEPLRGAHAGHRAAFASAPAARVMGKGRMLWGRRKDGALFPVEVTLSHLTTARGELSVAFITDITQRHMDRLALEESAERFRLLSETVPQLVWTCGPDGGADYLNSRWSDYTGVPCERQLGHAWLERVHPADRAAAMDAWRLVSEGRATEYLQEYRIQSRDGAYRWFRARALPLRNGAGGIVKWFGASSDIHDLRAAMEELRAANADLESFAYIAAHDMQEPFRTVSSFTQLLERHLGGQLDERGRTLLNHVGSAAKRMSQLFADLLAYSEAGGGGETGHADLGVCCQLAIANLEQAIRENAAVVEAGPLPVVRGREVHFVQVFQNLIGNAIKYRGEEAPRIAIACEDAPGCWRVRVADNGIGIDPAHHRAIFGLFRRLHGRDTAGTGLGLAICQRVITRHRGRIWVESEGDGHGSRFVIELPRA